MGGWRGGQKLRPETWKGAGILEAPEAKQLEWLMDKAQKSRLERQEQVSPLYGLGSAPEGPKGQPPNLLWRGGSD